MAQDLGQVRPKVRVPLEEGERVAEKVRAELLPVADVVLVGSIRRRRQVIADVEFVVLPKIGLKEFDEMAVVMGFERGAKMRKYTGHRDGLKVELYLAHDPLELGALTQTYTGDYLFNIAIRSKAKRMGYKLDQYGIWKGKKLVFQSPDEREIFNFVGMDWHWPEERSLAVRQELAKMARKLLAELGPEERPAAEYATEKLKGRTPLTWVEEKGLRALHARHFGEPILKGAELGAEELLELGIMAPDGLFDAEQPWEPYEDPEGIWQRLYESATGGSGQINALVLRRVGPRAVQIWAEVIEEGRPVFYTVYTGDMAEEETSIAPDEFLSGFSIWAIESGEAPAWLGPFESMPKMM